MNTSPSPYWPFPVLKNRWETFALWGVAAFLRAVLRDVRVMGVYLTKIINRLIIDPLEFFITRTLPRI